MCDILDTTGKALELAEKGGSLISQFIQSRPDYIVKMRLLEQIQNSKDMSETEKNMTILHIDDLVNKIKKLSETYDYAEKILRDRNVPIDSISIDDTWRSMFDDFAQNASNDQMKILWAKILADKCENPKSVSKKLLSILQVIETEMAETFSYISERCFIFHGEHQTRFFFPYFADKNLHDANYLDVLHLSDLEDIGLIKVEALGFYTLSPKNICLEYYGSLINIGIKNNAKIPLGKVTLTTYGEELVKVLYNPNTTKDMDYFNKVAQFYKELDYNVTTNI